MAEQEENEVVQGEEQAQAVQVAEAPEQPKKALWLGPKNLCDKYGISRDDFGASIQRLVKWILDGYNFGSELVTIMLLDLIRHGDIPEEKESGNKQVGIYRR